MDNPIEILEEIQQELQPLANFPLSLSLSSNSCVFPVVQSNGHSCVFPAFCYPLFYTYIPIKILRFSYSYVFSILRFKGALSKLNYPIRKVTKMRDHDFIFALKLSLRSSLLIKLTQPIRVRKVNKMKDHNIFQTTKQID